ncbi:hypothetical protein [Rathayibacter toxicus]|uniref:hypothetical protein n=1 Tax=Rathayibacter toxicus TaxID=145458 RepID=UPI0012DD9778|nr:hypothetical protein [Rathayibacter toxicus]QOD09541.1 hypothetical protein BSG36_06010 [Rathayibacter toxicus]
MTVKGFAAVEHARASPGDLDALVVVDMRFSTSVTRIVACVQSVRFWCCPRQTEYE